MREGFSAALMHDDVYRNLERRTLQASTATKEYDRQRLEISQGREEPIAKLFTISTARSITPGFFLEE